MAYTYDDFVSAANNAGLLSKFSTADIETAKKNPEFGLSLLGFMQDEANATTSEGRLLAQEGANQLRSNVGNYTVGTDGVAVSTVQDIANQMKNYGDFTFANEQQRQDLINKTSNPEQFSYDLENDPLWGVYKKQATREGERAISDVLAKASAGTGGVPSSYAVSAATQAGDQYAASLTDMIPTLRQNAYNEYLNNYNMNLEALGVLNDERALTYDEWLQKYNMLGSNLSVFQGLEDRELAKKQDNHDRLASLISTSGYTPSQAELVAAGMSEEQAKSYRSYYTQQQAAAQAEQEAAWLEAQAKLLEAQRGEDSVYIDYKGIGVDNYTGLQTHLAAIAANGDKALEAELEGWYNAGLISYEALLNLYEAYSQTAPPDGIYTANAGGTVQNGRITTKW